MTKLLLFVEKFCVFIQKEDYHFCIWLFVKNFDVYSTKKEVCRNARCTSFFVHHYTNLFTFFKLRSFEDFFDLCVPSI